MIYALIRQGSVLRWFWHATDICTNYNAILAICTRFYCDSYVATPFLFQIPNSNIYGLFFESLPPIPIYKKKGLLFNLPTHKKKYNTYISIMSKIFFIFLFAFLLLATVCVAEENKKVYGGIHIYIYIYFITCFLIFHFVQKC